MVVHFKKFWYLYQWAMKLNDHSKPTYGWCTSGLTHECFTQCQWTVNSMASREQSNCCHEVRGELIDCSPRSHWISVLLPNLQYTSYKNNSFAISKSDHLIYLIAWISQRCLKQATVHSVSGKLLECFMIQKIKNKTRETLWNNKLNFI